MMKKLFYFIAFCVLLGDQCIHAQTPTAASYTFSAATGATYSTIVYSGSVIGILSAPLGAIDSVATSIPIGFSFNYCGANYSTLSVASDGWLSLVNAPTDLTGMPGSGVGLLMPFRCSANGYADTVWYNVTGTAPLRVFTVEFRKYHAYPGTGIGNFQVKLYESTNAIKFCYSSSTIIGSSCSIGISNSVTDYQTLATPVSTVTSSTTYTSTLNATPAAGVELTWLQPASFSSSGFSVNVDKLCNGPEFTVMTNTWSSGYVIKSYFGDGTLLSSSVGTGAGGVTGATVFAHAYGNSGTYTIKHILFNGATPIDSILYSNEYVFCKTLPVRFYYDYDNNCVYNAAIDRIVHFPFLTEIDSNGVPIDTISSVSGFYYKAYGHPGDIYKIKVLSGVGGGLFVSCPIASVISDTLSGSLYSSAINEFGVSCTTGAEFDLSANAIPPRLGVHIALGDIYVSNSYCIPEDAVVTLHHSPKYVYDTVAPHPSSVSATSVTWNFAGMSANDYFTPIKLHYQFSNNPVTGYLIDGDTVHTTVTMTPATGDIDSTNNEVIRVDTVDGSWDPNRISVTPTGCLPVDELLRFTIQFENTGHDTAFNIYIMDTLSDNLDPSTMRMIMSSNTMYVSKLKDGGHTILKFDFPGINLPDSSHHGLCDGALIYTIKAKAGIPVASSIVSQAGIYFDYNDVVMTNTVVNTKCWPTEITTPHADLESHIFPNPATTELTIKTDQNTYTSFTITNAMGQLMMQQDISIAQTKVNVRSLPTGLYIVTLKGEQRSVVEKFVKW